MGGGKQQLLCLCGHHLYTFTTMSRYDDQSGYRALHPLSISWVGWGVGGQQCACVVMTATPVGQCWGRTISQDIQFPFHGRGSWGGGGTDKEHACVVTTHHLQDTPLHLQDTPLHLQDTPLHLQDTPLHLQDTTSTPVGYTSPPAGYTSPPAGYTFTPTGYISTPAG